MTNQPPMVKEIETAKLLPPWSMLRPVRESSIEFMELVDSIRDNGLFKCLLARPHPTREGHYEIIDGMWRFFACKQLDFREIPCILKVDVVDDEHFLALQIQANAVIYGTQPVEFAEQMQRMMQIRESVGSPMTLAELGRTVGKSSAWVSQRLKLLSLCDEVKKELKDGKINLGKAVAIARIRLNKYQKEFLEKAPSMKTRDFELAVGNFIAEKRNEKMGKRRELRDEITLHPRIQSMDTMLMELDRMDNLSQIIVTEGLTTAVEGARIALEWVLNLHKDGRDRQVKEVRHKLSDDDRKKIIGRQRYEELEKMRKMREQRADNRF